MKALEPLVVSIVVTEGIDEDAVRKSTLVVCDGGSLSGQQALAAGVPILGLAQTQSEKDFMAVVRRSGAGESQDPLRVTAGICKE
jgi:UDP:flavonoid glycosyltransferase YjiC (YdhE family)